MSEWCPLSEIADTNPETLPANTDRDYSFRYIDLGSVEAGHIDWHKVQYIRYGEAPSRARRRVAAGDVLFGTVRPNLQSHGYIDKTQKGELVASTGFSVVRARPAVSHGKYLFFALLGHDVYRQAVNAAVGSNYPAVNDSDVRRFKIFAPHVAEQKKIAQILDTLDTQIRQTEALIAKLEQLKQGLLTDLLTRGIDEHGQLRPPPEEAPHLYKDSPLGLLPRAWSVAALAEVLEGIDAGKSPDCQDIPATGDEWGVLKVGAVHPNGLRLEENKVVEDARLKNKAYLVKNGDLLISRANTSELVGLVCFVDNNPRNLMLSDKTLRLRVDETKMFPRFVFLQLQMPSARRQIEVAATGTSGSMKNISQSGIKSLLIPRPSLEEQQTIATRSEALEKRLAVERANRHQLREVKAGLMDDLLTGRVRVTPLLDKTERAAI